MKWQALSLPTGRKGRSHPLVGGGTIGARHSHTAVLATARGKILSIGVSNGPVLQEACCQPTGSRVGSDGLPPNYL